MLARKLTAFLALALLLVLGGCSDDGDGGSNGLADVADTGVDVADSGTDSGGDTTGDILDTDVDGGVTGDPELFDPGPYAVGYRELTVSYDAPGVAEPRELPLKVWYPAVDDSGAEPAEYAVSGIVSIDPGLALDAPPPAEDGPYPVAVYSHGSGGEGLLAYPYAERFASYGWVVAAPNHVGNTAIDAFRGQSDPFAKIALHRVTDITAGLDSAEDDFGDPELAGISDLDAAFLFGHSFGAYTTLAVGGADLDFETLESRCADFDDGSCEFLSQPDVETAFEDFGDNRIDAIAPQAPALVNQFVDGELAAIEHPTLLMSGQLDRTTTTEAQAEPAWEGLDGEDDVWVEMAEGAHLSFISICHDLDRRTIESFRPEAYDDGCGEGFIPTTVAVPVLRAYLLAYARLHVLGQSEWADVFTGEPLYDGFVTTTR